MLVIATGCCRKRFTSTAGRHDAEGHEATAEHPGDASLDEIGQLAAVHVGESFRQRLDPAGDDEQPQHGTQGGCGGAAPARLVESDAELRFLSIRTPQQHVVVGQLAPHQRRCPDQTENDDEQSVEDEALRHHEAAAHDDHRRDEADQERHPHVRRGRVFQSDDGMPNATARALGESRTSCRGYDPRGPFRPPPQTMRRGAAEAGARQRRLDCLTQSVSCARPDGPPLSVGMSSHRAG